MAKEPADIRKQLLHALEQDWGTYVARVRRLSREERRVYLSTQGYARLADLLAHVIAWWKEGYLALDIMLRDPNFQSPDYDDTIFNAAAVESVSHLDEAEVVEAFEAMRLAYYKRIADLPAGAFQDERIARRLQIEIIGHYHEHALS